MNKYIKLLITSCFVLICIPFCKNNELKDTSTSKEYLINTNENYRITNFNNWGPKEILLNPSQVSMLGEKLIVTEVQRNNVFIVFDLHDPTKYFFFGKKGRGPGEFLSPDLYRHQLFNAEKNTFSIFDPFRKSLFEMDYSSISKGFEPEVIDKTFVPISMQIVTGFSRLDDSICIGTSTAITNKFFKWNRTNDSIEFLGESDFLKPSTDFPEQFISYILTSTYSINQTRKRIAFAYYLFDIIDIFNFEGDLIRRIKGSPNIDFPKVTATKSSFSPVNAISYYDDIYTTDSCIYALYYGFVESQFENSANRSKIKSKIHILNWDGDLIDKLELNGLVTSICVSGDSLLFGLQPLNYSQPIFMIKLLSNK